jgi:3-phytase
MKSSILFATLLVATLFGCSGTSSERPAAAKIARLQHAVATEPLGEDADDPAIWISRSDPERSLIIGTNKAAAPQGALVVFGLDGKIVQRLGGLDRPNNVDVDYGLLLNGKPTDFAITTERYKQRLRVYAINPETRQLSDISSPEGLRVFEGEAGERAAPMGVSVYQRPADGALFAIVSRKEGPQQGYLWQYRLEDDGSGRVKATKVRELGVFSGAGEIEAVAVDDELGYVYYADEGDGIHKWHADPDHADAAKELAHFGKDGFKADREGIAIYALSGVAGYIICTDQMDGGSDYHVFRREGSVSNPHDHSERVRILRGGADATDGIEATSTALGPLFPRGLLAAMNSSGRNFLLYDWAEIEASSAPARE